MDLDEILTGVTGFIIAMVIVGVAIGLVIYGYYIYAQHQTLENYLWPVADLVPAQGNGYWLAVINTGQEPFYVKYIIYKNGEAQRTNSGVLHHNQYWLKHLDQLPAEVMVCSALNPNICTTAPVHYWYIPQGTIYVFLSGTGSNTGNNNGNNTNQPPPPGSIEVIVNDVYGAGWQITWTDTQGVVSGSQSGSSNAQWTINNVPSNDSVTFNAQITSTSPLQSCSITPQNTTAYPGQTVTFTVSCRSSLPAVLVGVNDPYAATWEVAWTYNGSSSGGSMKERFSFSWFIYPPSFPAQISFNASIIQNPSGGWACTIQPSSITKTYWPGSAQYFNVTCQLIMIQVNDPYGAGWQITLSPSGLTWSGNNTESFYVNQWVNLPQSVTATITSMPPGATSCNITGPTQITKSGIYTYNVECQGMLVILFDTSYSDPSPPSSTAAWGWQIQVQYPNGTKTWLYFSSNGPNGQSTYTVYAGPVNNITVLNVWQTMSPCTNAHFSVKPKPPVSYDQQGVYTIYAKNWCNSQNSGGGGGIIWVQVYDNPGAGWSITASGGANGTYTGSSSTAFPVKASNTTYFTASITSIPNGYSSCSINPPSQSANPGQTIAFTVSCSNSTNSPPPTTGSISVSVTNDTLGAGWEVTWSDAQGKVSGSQGGSSDYSWTISNVPSGDTVYFSASITSSPSGYKCTISPQSTSAGPGGSVTFTVSCTSTQPPKPQYYCYVTAYAYDNIGGASDPTVSPSSAKLAPGDNQTFTFSAKSTVTINGTTYDFEYWVINGQYYYENPATYTFICPSNLSGNDYVTIIGTATYQPTSSGGGVPIC